MIRYQNLSLNRLLSLVDDGEIFEFCNFTQAVMDTEIFSGATGLTFRDCNLVNCIVPKDSIVERCNTTRKSFCRHLHPNWELTECAENCDHVSDYDEIWIDDVLVDTEYYYEDIVL